MNRVFTAGIVTFSLLAGCGGPEGESAQTREPAATANEPARNASTELKALVEEFFQRELELNPLLASSIGDDRYNDRLANYLSPEYRQEDRAHNQKFLDRLLTIDPADLETQQERLTYATFRWDREMELESFDYPDHLQPIDQFYSIPNLFAQLGSGSSIHPFETVDDYDDFLSRAGDFVEIMDQAIDNMRIGMEQGIVQPTILMQRVLPQLEAQFADKAEDTVFWTPIENMPEAFSAQDRERLTGAYRTAIMEKIIPAYRRLHEFIANEYMPATRETHGLGALPGGDEWYAYRVRLRTTTDMTPAEIHRIGLDEVKRIHAEMQAVMDEVGFEDDLEAFFEYVNTEDRFYYDEPERIIQGYRNMADRVERLTPKLFSVFPKTDFEVRPVEPFREKSASAGSYRSGSPDGSRPGVFFANTYDVDARPKWAMESLFLHEAIPGHHFQISIQQELENLPDFRRFGGYTAFTEGWGLYAETLGKELGVYTDPYQHFGALNAELWRAIRLVVDTGLHSKGWTREQVLDYMYANSAVKEARAVSEAERYMAIPGQALAYKIGQLKIQELKGRAEAALGERFDIKAFHTAVLESGSLPLDLLERKIERWIDSRQT